MAKAWALYKNSEESAEDTVKAILSDVKLWGEDLCGKVDVAQIAHLTHSVVTNGVKSTMSKC